MKFVITEIQRGIDRFEGLEIDVDLSFLPFRGQNFATVDNQAICWNFIV